MHNKFLVIDAEGTAPRVVTGSMNWSTSGDERNDENTLIVHDGGTAMAYAAGFWELYDALGEETLCEVEFGVYLPVATERDDLREALIGRARAGVEVAQPPADKGYCAFSRRNVQ
jgi:phosphatidylserine/phosphatidylglycerophosphate/cardiolipin synthase-like enzyme